MSRPVDAQEVQAAVQMAESVVARHDARGVTQHGAMTLARVLLFASIQLELLANTLREIADPSYVGNYSERDVAAIYRQWAHNALREAGLEKWRPQCVRRVEPA